MNFSKIRNTRLLATLAVLTIFVIAALGARNYVMGQLRDFSELASGNEGVAALDTFSDGTRYAPAPEGFTRIAPGDIRAGINAGTVISRANRDNNFAAHPCLGRDTAIAACTYDPNARAWALTKVATWLTIEARGLDAHAERLQQVQVSDRLQVARDTLVASLTARSASNEVASNLLLDGVRLRDNATRNEERLLTAVAVHSRQLTKFSTLKAEPQLLATSTQKLGYIGEIIDPDEPTDVRGMINSSLMPTALRLVETTTEAEQAMLDAIDAAASAYPIQFWPFGTEYANHAAHMLVENDMVQKRVIW